jgi:lon-related putative ATP-dependent protease
MSQTMLKPQPVDLNVKVIMIGDAEIYHALYFSEEDFKKIFKINAEFDYEATKSREMIMNYAKFMKKLCEQEQLLHFNRSGVARVIEWAVEHTESQNKITLQFSDVADVMREASFFAQKNKAKVVTGEYVDFALEARRFRNDIYDAKIKEKIIDGSVLIATTGTRVGQINGLTVYDTGLVSFGKPARITVTVGVGSTDIVSIEREVEMSGSIHDKGIMTITGLMREKFAQKRPLTLSASVAFEQNYGGIDGDSASAAEVIALFSALSNIAVRQDIAITGSVNQKGDIQPIGGVNEKITGFFEICQERGLTGTQGVVIPIQNIHDLMLPTKVIDAVKQGLFFISPVATIDEAAEIMLDYPTGAAATEENPQYLYSIIDKRLEELHLAAESEPKDEKKKKKKRKKT